MFSHKSVATLRSGEDGWYSPEPRYCGNLASFWSHQARFLVMMHIDVPHFDGNKTPQP